LLKRASIEASRIIPVGKETDRRWEQGEDPSMLDFKVLEYQSVERMVIADQQILDDIAKHGVRGAMRTDVAQAQSFKMFPRELI
jgi:hypothetical protein